MKRFGFQHTNAVRDASIKIGDRPVAPDVIAILAADEPIQDAFLDQIAFGLRALPETVRLDMRREMRAHIENLTSAHEELGEDHQEAVASALRQLGDPTLIARRFRIAWKNSGRSKNLIVSNDVLGGACCAAFLAIAYAWLLKEGVAISMGAERTAGHGIVLAPEFIGLPLVGQIPFLVPIIADQHFGKRWAEAGIANARFWLTLAASVVVLSSVQQFLQCDFILRGQLRFLSNDEKVRIFEDLFRQMIPTALLSAIFARQRRVAPTPLLSVTAGVGLSLWILVTLLSELNSMAYSPVSVKTILLHGVANWSLPCAAVAAALWLKYGKRRQAFAPLDENPVPVPV